jgi:hypothetical protein
MELQDHLHQLQYIDILLEVEVVEVILETVLQEEQVEEVGVEAFQELQMVIPLMV